jgi:prephenate dehydrogenase
MIQSIGIIGFGRFGQLAAFQLKKHFQVFTYDKNDKRKIAEKIGIKFVDLKDCATKNIVLLCVPISNFEDVLNQITPYLNNSLVIDVCSVKEEPVNIMKKIVPKDCECIGSHPLFGPDTVKNGLKDKKIVLCPVRITRLKEIKDFLAELGLKVIISTPEEHDKQMAKSLGLVHLIGRSLYKIGVNNVEMTTPSHEMFIELVNIVKNDSKQLFFDMQHYNRFSKEIRKKLLRELIKIDGELK